jgi:hypothetical protein
VSQPKPKEASAKARRTGCAILEVLAGLRTPKEASEALGLSLQRYYSLEARAIEGLVAALEPRPRGRQVSGKVEASRLREERDRLQRELQRAHSLVRVAQRSIGLSAAQSSAQRQKAKAKAKKAGKRGPRRPSVRARRAIKRLQPKDEGQPKPQKEAS